MENEGVEGCDELSKDAAQTAAVSPSPEELDPEDLDTGLADRREITHQAQLDALEAVSVLSVAMESDEKADKAMRSRIAADRARDYERAREYQTVEREARRKANADHSIATESARRAYEAVKFSAPNKMGFMRVVQLGFIAHIFATVIALLLATRDSLPLNITLVVDWITVILEGMALWMLAYRYKLARPFIIGISIASLAIDLIIRVTTHSFSLLLFISDGLFYLFLIFYFLFSRRVKATLVNDLSSYRPWKEGKDFVIERRGWPFYRNLIIYFITFSVLGHWMEMAMCQLIIAGLVEGDYDPSNTMLWRDWLYPFPMEGAAVVLIAVALYPLYDWLKRKYGAGLRAHLLSFVANALTCSLIEFCGGLVVNSHYELWDYRNNFGNIMGQVCLQNALAFGAACSIIAWFVYPMLEKWIASLPYDVMNIGFVATLAFGCVTWALYVVDLPALFDKFHVDTTITLPFDFISDTGPDSASDEIVRLRLTASDLRQRLAEEEGLTEEQRAELSAQLESIEQSIGVMEMTLASEVPDATESLAPANG